jgi:predicted MPP superfamily phosphohydrolase
LFVAVLISAFYHGLTITEYTVYDDKIDNAVNIVFLSDLHSCTYGKSQQGLIQQIHKQKPDLVLMSGDIADDVLPDSRVTELLDGIANQYPCYYVTGNHEFWSGRVDEQKDMFRAYGVTVLEGNGEEISVNGQHLFIGGIDDPDVGGELFDSQLKTVSGLIRTERYSILLSHRPELFERYANYAFDLVLSGHAHGGQWRIPLILPNGLFAPNQGWFPKYTTGIHEMNDTKMLVSRGLSRESTRIPRIFNPPELVVIHLVPKPSS